MDHVRRTTERILEREVGTEYVDIYRKWQSLGNLDRPIIILMGGATGVGKSTVATMLAARFGITRQVSTDVIREVMRSLFAQELMPALYSSSFNAFEALRIPLPRTTDKVIVGFLEQAAMVWVGIRALIERAILERTNFIVEGAHVVPGIIDPQFFKRRVRDSDGAVGGRTGPSPEPLRDQGGRDGGSAPVRALPGELREVSGRSRIMYWSWPKAQEVPVFPCYNMDATVGAIIEYVIDQVFGAQRVRRTAGKAGGSPAGKTSGRWDSRQKEEWSEAIHRHRKRRAHPGDPRLGRAGRCDHQPDPCLQGEPQLRGLHKGR